MEMPITRKAHAFADYTYSPAMALLPNLVGFSDDKKATTISRIISGGVLATGLLTRAEWGIFKLIPFKAHIVNDFAVSLFTLSAPWLFGFSKNAKARNTFVAAGVVGLLAGALTRPEEMPAYKK